MTSKQKIRDKRQLKQQLKRFGACLLCGPQLGRKIPEDAEVAVMDCPKCGRALRFDVSSSSEQSLEALKLYAKAVAVARNIPAVLFTITFNEKVLIDDPPCGCPSVCEHYRMDLKLVLPDSIQNALLVAEVE